MVNVRHKRCGLSGCSKYPSYGKAGGKAQLCAENAEKDMVNVRHNKCGLSGCSKHPSYGKAGNKAENSLSMPWDGMVGVAHENTEEVWSPRVQQAAVVRQG